MLVERWTECLWRLDGVWNGVLVSVRGWSVGGVLVDRGASVELDGVEWFRMELVIQPPYPLESDRVQLVLNVIPLFERFEFTKTGSFVLVQPTEP